VEVRYHRSSPGTKDYDLNDAISDVAEELAREGEGDVLVFLPGEREIRERRSAEKTPPASHRDPALVRAALGGGAGAHIQGRTAAGVSCSRPTSRKTSLTVPGSATCGHGSRRVKRYSYRSKGRARSPRRWSRARYAGRRAA